MKEHEGNMKEYERNMRKYEANMREYEGNMKEIRKKYEEILTSLLYIGLGKFQVPYPFILLPIWELSHLP